MIGTLVTVTTSVSIGTMTQVTSVFRSIGCHKLWLIRAYLMMVMHWHWYSI